MDLSNHASGIGALADETRRRLYDYVVAQRSAVGREQAGSALDLPTHTASFHLDKLVGEGLLEVEFRRLTGRTGPGAGRPSKLYRRSEREFAVSLPARRYDVVGEILAEAIDRMSSGTPFDDALATSAYAEGTDVARATAPHAPGLGAVCEVLAGQGYEPRVEDDDVVLDNCPFDALANKHTALICGLNQSFVQGVVDGVGCEGVTAHLEPEPGQCCVKARRDDPAGTG